MNQPINMLCGDATASLAAPHAAVAWPRPSCMTEAEKYEGSLYKPKAENKAQRVAREWGEVRRPAVSRTLPHAAVELGSCSR